MTKVDDLQEELNARIKERSSHGKTFDEIDLVEMEQNCKITGMHFSCNRTHQTKDFLFYFKSNENM